MISSRISSAREQVRQGASHETDAAKAASVIVVHVGRARTDVDARAEEGGVETSVSAATVEAMTKKEHEAAVAALRDAVLACRASDEWMNDDRQMMFDLVQFSIARWVDDLGRSLLRAAKAIAEAREHAGEPDEEMAEELEEALTQLGSARDKLVAVIALVFGVPSLVPQKPGMKFEPKEGVVKGPALEARRRRPLPCRTGEEAARRAR